VVLALTLPWWTWTLLLCLVLGLGAWLVFLWAIRTGQFKDPERTAQQMLELDERERAPTDPRRL
jgi:cbb3-type cytochrome oxidase maturation protein